MKSIVSKRILSAAICVTASVIPVSAAGYRGDVNADGKVDMKDMAMLATALKNQYFAPPKSNDLNADGKVDDKDLHYLADLIIQGKLIDNSGVNVGIGGWEDSGEDFGGTVGGNTRSGLTRADGDFSLDAGAMSYDRGTGLTYRELTVSGTPAGVLVDLIVPSEIQLDPAYVTVLTGNGVVSDQKLYGTPKMMKRNDERHLRFIVMSPALTGFTQSGAFCRIAYKTESSTTSFRFSECQTTGGSTFSYDVGKEWKFISVESIELVDQYPEGGYRLEVGSAIDLRVTVSPGEASDQRLSWSSSAPGVASVDDNGHVDIKASGTAEVTVSALDGSGVVRTVSFTGYSPVKNIEISVPGLEGKNPVEGTTLQLGALITPETADNKTVEWRSSDVAVATVNKDNGLVTFVAPGDVTITVRTLDGSELTKSVSFTVDKRVVAVTGITINDPGLGGKNPVVGSTLTLTAAVTPDDATDKSVAWTSSDETVATVGRDSGLVTFVASGTVTITATSNGNPERTASCTFTVENQTVAVEGITINDPGLGGKNPVEGSTLTLTAAVTPDDATDKSVAWTSSDESVATVGRDSGLVTFVAFGTVTITATSNGNPEQTASCTFTVEKQTVAVEGITINDPGLGGKNPVVGSTLTLTAAVTPDDATDKSVAWTSSDESVATVGRDSGLVTFVASGTVTITATSNGNPEQTASCTFTVEKQTVAVSGITINDPGLGDSDPVEGSTLTLTVTVTPDDASNKSVEWITSNPQVATVKDGVVTFVAPGEVTITVRTLDGSGLEASYSFTCVARIHLATGITIVDDETGEAVPEGGYSLEEGSTKRLRAVVTPEETTDKSVEWLSSDSSIATVNGGVVKVQKAGVVTITAHTLDGSDLKAECRITGTSGIEQILEDVTGPVDIYDMRGMTVKIHASKEDVYGLPQGTYIIKSSTCTIKIRR